MHSRRRIGLLAVLACLALTAPAAAQGTQPNTGSSPPQGTSTQDSSTSAAVPSRVRSRLARADSSLKRASDAIDDGDNAKAIAALKGVAKNLTAGANAAKRRAGENDGPASIGAVADAQHRTISDVAGLYDGVTDTDTVNQLTSTLKTALDGRDDLVATISGLAADHKASYADVLQTISGDIADGIASVQGALSDDTLKDPEAKDALNAALTQLQASASTVSALLSGLGTTSPATSQAATQNTSAAGAPPQQGNCPKRDGSGSRQEQGANQQQQPQGAASGQGTAASQGGRLFAPGRAAGGRTRADASRRTETSARTDATSASSSERPAAKREKTAKRSAPAPAQPEARGPTPTPQRPKPTAHQDAASPPIQRAAPAQAIATAASNGPHPDTHPVDSQAPAQAKVLQAPHAPAPTAPNGLP